MGTLGDRVLHFNIFKGIKSAEGNKWLLFWLLIQILFVFMSRQYIQNATWGKKGVIKI